MRTSDVRVNNQYLYKGKTVIVEKRIKGRWKTGTGMFPYHTASRTRRRFLLNTGEQVFSDKLEKTVN